MTAGRKPKPTAHKQLAGNPGKRALNADEPQYPAANPRVPKGKLPEDAADLWRALAHPMAAAGVLKVTDLPALEMLCLHYAVARAALARLLADGRVEVENAEGQLFTVSEGLAITVECKDGIKKHPAVSVLRESSLAFKSYLSEFGLTPSSRAQIKVGASEREMTLAEALFAAASTGEPQGG